MGISNRLKWLVPAWLALGATGVAYAQQTPPPAEAEADADAEEPALLEEQENDEDAIVVTARGGDQIRIDRRTYTLRDDATAQSTNMFDVLGRIPSVSVAPSGEITLLGASNVTIQINGQPVQGANLEQVLRGIPGGSVERIEVITNPSAQYSAAASGGIINIITRDRFDAGFNGTVQSSYDNLGGYHFGVAPTWSVGDWTFSGQAGFYGGESETDLTRQREILPAGPVTFEDGARDFEYDGWYASRLQASYLASERLRYTVGLDAGAFNFDNQQQSALSDTLGPLSTRAFRTLSEQQFNQLTFGMRLTGDQPREETRLDAALFSFEQHQETGYLLTPSVGVASAYTTSSDRDNLGARVTLDIERPLEGERFLTYGASLDYSDLTLMNALSAISGVTPLPYAARLDGIDQTLALYTTYQFATGDWTWLPGLRTEHNRREVVSGALETDEDDLRFFPSLHIRRALTPEINIDLSYTSRIQRPDVAQLDPALRFVEVDRAFSGNPNLDPTTTDAYEASFVYQKNGASFSVTFFDRISDDVFSQFTSVTPGGVIVTMPVNAGTSEQRGLQALLRGPLGERWRYSISGNILSREFDYLSGGLLQRREEFEYDGILQLDYRDPDQNAVGADQLQFEVRFQGPRHGLQTEIDEFVMANFTWRRRLTPRLNGVLTVTDIFGSVARNSEVTTDTYFERTEFGNEGTRVRLALTYQFGAGPQRPLQDQQQPGPPPVPQ